MPSTDFLLRHRQMFGQSCGSMIRGGTTCGQLPAPVTCSENVVRSRRGLRRSNRNRAKKRSRLGTRNSTDLNFRGFEPPGGLIADLFLGKPERTGSMSRPLDKRVLEDGREGTPPRALRGSTGDVSGRFSWKTTTHTLWRSFTSRIGPQHPEQHCECSGPAVKHCAHRSNTVRTGQNVHR